MRERERENAIERVLCFRVFRVRLQNNSSERERERERVKLKKSFNDEEVEKKKKKKKKKQRSKRMGETTKEGRVNKDTALNMTSRLPE